MPASSAETLDGRGGPPGAFEEVYRRSLEHPEEFWAQAAAEIDWYQEWDQVLDSTRAPSIAGLPAAS